MIRRALLAACLVLAGTTSAAHHSPANFNLDVTDFAVTGTIARVRHWDGDTLVVETRAIRAITFGSVPHSDSVHVVERWNVVDDGGSVVNELMITDPVMYAEPIVLSQYYTRAPPGTRMLEYECTEAMWLDHERAREQEQGRTQ